MNMKKMIPLTFAALSVAGALSACSDSTVSGADVQDNSMAQRSSSSVDPGSSSSSVISNDVLSQVVARLKEQKSNVPITVINSTAEYVVDTIDALGTFNRYRDVVIDKDELKFEMSDSLLMSIVAMRDEKSVMYGPFMFLDNGDSKQLLCMSSVNVPKREHGDMVLYGEHENLELRVAPVWDGMQKMPDKYRISRRISVYDSSVVELFKSDCVTDNGSYSKVLASTKTYEDELGNVTVYNDSAYSCTIEYAKTENGNVYKDAYWQKYVSIIFNRCVGPLDSYASNIFDKSEDSNESEQ